MTRHRRDNPRNVQGGAAKPGDALIVTHPLGAGVLSAAAEGGRLSRETLADAIREKSPERGAALESAMSHYGVRASIQIGGAGLAGAAIEIAKPGGVTLIFEESDLPLLPEALDLVRGGIISSGGKRNRVRLGPQVRIAEEVGDEMVEIFFDPQPPAGWLIAVAAEESTPMLANLQNSGLRDAAIVGRIAPRGKLPVELV